MKKILLLLTILITTVTTYSQENEEYYVATSTEMYIRNKNTNEWELYQKNGSTSITIIIEKDFISIQAKKPSIYKIFNSGEKIISTENLQGTRFLAKDLKSEEICNVDILKIKSTDYYVINITLNEYNYWKQSNNTFNVGSATKYLNWDGSNLVITGTINATGGTFSGSITASGTISGGTISGATITGGTIQTAANGDRVELNNGSYLNKLSFWTSATVPGTIYSYTSGGQNILSLSSPYSSGNQGQINIYSLAPNSYINLSADQTSASGSMTAGSFYTGTPDTSASAESPGTYIGSNHITARRDGSSITTSSVYFAHRYSDTGQTNPSFFRAIRNTATVGNLRYNTSTSTFETATSSDYRLKENIIDHNLLESTQIIKNIPIKKFNFKSDLNKNKVVGFIAHELEEVAPYAVMGEKDAVDEDNNPIYQEVGFSSLIPTTIAALKQALLKIDELEQRLDALEG